MKDIIRENRRLDFSSFTSLPTFELYSIEGGTYDFTENLNFANNQSGVYIFLTVVFRMDMNLMDITPMCTMLYCGKTKDLSQRFDNHHHKDDLKTHNPLYIAVAYCKDEEETAKLEKVMLDTFFFEFNDPSTNKGTIKDTIKAVRISVP